MNLDHSRGRGETVIRRLDKLAFMGMVILAAAGVWSLTEITDENARVIVGFFPFLATGIALFYLAGPAAYIAVTKTHVVVANPMVRYDVPRSLVDGVQGHSRLNIELRVLGHSPIDMSALIPGVGGGHTLSVAEYERRLRAILRLMEETPMVTTAGSVARSWRPVHVALLVLCLACMIASVVYLGGGSPSAA
ncbi:hypothetical protein ACN26Y_00360 [Micromonospora sp. WMMD558]|uniref:hypothetical protein n=1 Tax=unclassified Micromonospora TaxID=2617518 RepID=UPI0012B4C532|nr:hypothetical protein [Micromonospora sp. WMMC415]QGN50131.1 hypothetical protein GKC29_27140 [Micromonospora sp. WMMC415]